MIKIFKGDSTSVGGRSLIITLPQITIDLTGAVLRFKLENIIREWTTAEGLASGASIGFELTKEETGSLDLGIHLASLVLVKGDMHMTFSNRIPIKVTDNVGEVYGSEISSATKGFVGKTIDVSDIGELVKANTLGEVKAVVNKLVDKFR